MNGTIFADKSRHLLRAIMHPLDWWTVLYYYMLLILFHYVGLVIILCKVTYIVHFCVKNTLPYYQIYRLQLAHSLFYWAVSSPLDRSKHFTRYPLADLFILAPFSTSLGIILVTLQLCGNTIHSHFHHRERKYPRFATAAKAIQTQAPSIENLAFYC